MSLLETAKAQMFFNNSFGIGNDLIHYLAQYYHRPPNPEKFDFEASKKNFIDRVHPDNLTAVNMDGRDVSIFKKRSELLVNVNAAYRIACTKYPSVTDLMDFSYLGYSWSVLFSLVHYLHHHPNDAKAYTGFLPFGAPVRAWMNNLIDGGFLDHRRIPGNPNYADHVLLQDFSNQLARTQGVASIEINLQMYIEGISLAKKLMAEEVIAEA